MQTLCRRNFLKTLGVAAAGTAMPALGVSAKKRPNFVFFLVDDLGYMDIAANNPGTFYETPNADRIAREGMRFTDGYAANPVCSPTRYSILTGKYPSRVDATNFFSGARQGKFKPAPLHSDMPLSEVTISGATTRDRRRAAISRRIPIRAWKVGRMESTCPYA